MKTARTLLRIGAVIGLGYTSAAWQCSESLGPPPGGGQVHESRQCQSQGDAQWKTANLFAQLVTPPCPYTVSAAGQPIEFAFNLVAPQSGVFNGAATTTDVFNEINAIVGGTDGQTLFGVLGADSVEDQVSGSWNAGTGGPPIADSVAFAVQGTVDGEIANGAVNLPGDISTGGTNVIGSPNVPVGASSWRAQSHWDTTMYLFNWFIDGNPVGTNKNATINHTFTLAASHNFRIVTILGSKVTDTTNFTVTVGPSATLSGPTVITSTASNTYTATPSGCNTTCTYNWTLQTKQGTSHWSTSTTTTSLQFFATEGSPLSLGVVAASNGITGYGQSLTIVNSQGSCTGKISC